MASMKKLPRYAVLDGGMATELVRQGHSDIDSDPLWSCQLLTTNIADIEAVHRSFMEAGSEIIETNTYQASVPGFVKYLGVSEGEAVELIERGVRCACTARDKFAAKQGGHPVLVAGSVGPYGASQHDGSEYTGNYVDSMSIQDLVEWHHPVVSALLSGGADLLAFDTIPAQKEAEAIALLLQRDFPACQAWISFSCKDGEHTVHGEKLCGAVSCLRDVTQVVGVGINCTDPDYITPLLTSIQGQIGDKLIIVYPNSGESWSADTKSWQEGEQRRPLAQYVDEWVSAGAGWIGGCCRTTPADVTAIQAAINKYR